MASESIRNICSHIGLAMHYANDKLAEFPQCRSGVINIKLNCAVIASKIPKNSFTKNDIIKIKQKTAMMYNQNQKNLTDFLLKGFEDIQEKVGRDKKEQFAKLIESIQVLQETAL